MKKPSAEVSHAGKRVKRVKRVKRDRREKKKKRVDRTAGVGSDIESIGFKRSQC